MCLVRRAACSVSQNLFSVLVSYEFLHFHVSNSGNLKFLFGLKCPSSAGGTSAIVVTDGGEYNQSGVSLR